MRKSPFLLFIVLISSLSFAFATDSLVCEFSNSACPINNTVFYASGNLSANVRIDSLGDAGLYNQNLCCTSPYGSIAFRTVTFTGTCPINSHEVMYFTSDTNARVAIKGNISHHSYKLCAYVEEPFSTMDIVINETNKYERLGYVCMYRVSDKVNGHVSACNATYDDTGEYTYGVWARLFENPESLKCNDDCTSKLDGRVYAACASKLEACKDVPAACDGSLLGGWVEEYSGAPTELQCSPPWNLVRDKVFTNEPINVESATGYCENLVSKKTTVLYNNEPVTMHIYICGD